MARPRDEAPYAMEATMSVRDLVPWNRGRDVTVRREESNPFLALHREMNRLFDDVFRGFDLAPFGFDRGFDRTIGWPNIEVSDTDKEMKVTAELPGLEEKDVELEMTMPRRLAIEAVRKARFSKRIARGVLGARLVAEGTARAGAYMLARLTRDRANHNRFA